MSEFAVLVWVLDSVPKSCNSLGFIANRPAFTVAGFHSVSSRHVVGSKRTQLSQDPRFAVQRASVASSVMGRVTIFVTLRASMSRFP